MPEVDLQPIRGCFQKDFRYPKGKDCVDTVRTLPTFISFWWPQSPKLSLSVVSTRRDRSLRRSSSVSRSSSTILASTFISFRASVKVYSQPFVHLRKTSQSHRPSTPLPSLRPATQHLLDLAHVQPSNGHVLIQVAQRISLTMH